MAVKKYTATMTFTDGNTQVRQDLLVNYPIRKKGYKIYLMGYNESAKTATLLFKKDIGEPFSIIGIIFIVGGTLFHCLGYPVVKRLSENKLDGDDLKGKKSGGKKQGAQKQSLSKKGAEK